MFEGYPSPSKLCLCLAPHNYYELLRVGRSCSATTATSGTKGQFCSEDCWSAVVRGYLVIELLPGVPAQKTCRTGVSFVFWRTSSSSEID